MVAQTEVDPLGKRSTARAALGEACPPAGPVLAAALQKWLDDLNGTRPPSRFVYVDPQLRRHVAACIRDLTDALAAYNAQDQKGMDAAIRAAASGNHHLPAEVGGTRHSSHASPSA